MIIRALVVERSSYLIMSLHIVVKVLLVIFLLQVAFVESKSIQNPQQDWIKELDDEDAIIERKSSHNGMKDSVIDRKENWTEEVVDENDLDEVNDEDSDEDSEELIDRNEEEVVIDKIIKINENVDEPLSEGDVKGIAGQLNENEKRSVVKDLNYIWRSRTIPYVMDSTISDTVNQNTGLSNRAAIEGAIRQFENKTCLRFRLKTDNDQNYINFFQESGCWSYIGMIGGRQNISIGVNCETLGIVQHEIMHALGFFHEQSRYDRDQFVEILWENIRPGVERNFYKQSSQNTVNLDSEYDYDGLMHYSSHSFSSNELPTILPIGNISPELGQRDGFSTQDLIQINKLYQCEDKLENTWSSWGPYSACTLVSGNCVKERQKFCFKDAISCNHNTGVIKESSSCDTSECIVNGHWGRWSAWTTCTQTCDIGTHSRTRACNNPAKSNGGSDCVGDSSETGLCGTWPCTLPTDAIACNFEDGTLCSFVSSVTNRAANTLSFDLNQGRTYSYYTGPVADHTSGTETGRYVYMEATGASPGDKGKLTSPELAQGTRCLSFYYFMSGLDINKLTATLSEPDKEIELVSIEGQQSPIWLLGRATIVSEAKHKVVFTALRGKDFRGDIALDDILITEGACSDSGLITTLQTTTEAATTEASTTTKASTTEATTTEATTTQTPTTEATTTEAPTTEATTTEATTTESTTEATTAETTTTQIPTTEATTTETLTAETITTESPTTDATTEAITTPTTSELLSLSEIQEIVDCDFTDSTCSWTQQSTNHVKFHQDQGGYIALDLSSSYGSSNQQLAVISSEVFQGNGEPCCFEFKYRMRGSEWSYLMAELVDGNSEPKILFSREGNQGKDWKIGYFDLDLPPGTDCKISFGAEVYGDSRKAKINLDDFSLKAGPCSYAQSPSKSLFLNPTNKLTGDKAVLESSLIFSDSEMCMKFLYRIRKNSGGVLKVESLTTDFGVEINENLFEKTSHPTQSKFRWGYVQLPVGTSYRLRLVGLPANSNSAMAVRRLKTFPGKCPIPIFECNFESDDCGLSGFSNGQCAPRSKHLRKGYVYSFDNTNCNGVETNKIHMNVEPSLKLPASGGCLEFKYLTKGQCPLKVLQSEVDESVRTVFEHSEIYSVRKWRRVRAPLQNLNGVLATNIKLNFMTTIDNSDSEASSRCGYVYLDSIKVKPTSCPPKQAYRETS